MFLNKNKKTIEPLPEPLWKEEWTKLQTVYPVGSEFILMDIRIKVLYFDYDLTDPFIRCIYADKVGVFRTISIPKKSFPFLLQIAGFKPEINHDR